MAKRVRVLFVCVGNSCRSQMAEALARHIASDVIEPASAGVYPLGTIAEATRTVLRERGVPLDGHFSKSLPEVSAFEADLVVNMSGYPGNEFLRGRAFEDWEVEDPYGNDLETHRRICDDIEARVVLLAARLRTKSEEAPRAHEKPPSKSRANEES